MLTLNLIQDAIVLRTGKSFHPVFAWTPAEYLMAVTGELGECANFVKKIKRLDDGDRPYNAGVDAESLRKAAGKEIADIIIYLCLLAERLNLNVEDLVIQKFNEVSDRVGSDMRLEP